MLKATVKRLVPTVPLFFFFTLSGCNPLSNYTPLEKPSGVHYAYTGDHGPEHWGDLSAEFAPCKTGQQQTPINITQTQGAALSPLQFNYLPSELRIINNGHTVQMNYEEGSTLVVGDQTYKLLQFHFHTPSEHTINGQHSAMELHLVHQNEAKQLAVVGLMINEGENNSALQQFWNSFPGQNYIEQVSPAIRYNIRDLLPSNQSYYNYSGSLTTPPCSENVNWFLLKEPITVSSEQLANFKRFYELNARPVLDLNGREVKESQ